MKRFLLAHFDPFWVTGCDMGEVRYFWSQPLFTKISSLDQEKKPRSGGRGVLGFLQPFWLQESSP